MINKHKPGEDADMSLAYRKCALIIIDGLGDQPIPELDHSTPLEAADTPVMNRMAGEGWYGLADPIQAGEIPNTHSGMGMLMGLAPEQVNRLRRGPIEASGTGRVLAVGEVAIRANFATLEDQGSGLLVTDRRAGRITSGADELAADLKDVDLGDGVSACLYSTDQHRGVLVLSGPGLSAE